MYTRSAMTSGHSTLSCHGGEQVDVSLKSRAAACDILCSLKGKSSDDNCSLWTSTYQGTTQFTLRLLLFKRSTDGIAL